MDKLTIITDSVSSAADQFKSISNDINSLTKPTDSEHVSLDDAPFNIPKTPGALETLGKNLSKFAERVKNISEAVSEAAEKHSSLQTTLDAKFPHPKGSEEEPEPDPDPAIPSVPVSPGDGNNSGSDSGSGSGADATKAAKTDKKGPVETELTEVGYVYADEDALTQESIDIFNHSSFQYDENGFAKIGDRYVEAVDYTVGNIGDVLRFTQKTGEVIECVIGINTFSEQYKHTLNFIVDKQSAPITPTKLTEGIIETNSSVDNIGPLAEAGDYTYIPPVTNDTVVTTASVTSV